MAAPGDGVTWCDVNSIFAALWARFGISAIDTWFHLQGLWQDPRTSLQEHAATVKRLAQIAHSDLSPVNRERYTFNAFVQSVNDLGPHYQFLARGNVTVKDELREGEAYLLSTQEPCSVPSGWSGVGNYSRRDWDGNPRRCRHRQVFDRL